MHLEFDAAKNEANIRNRGVSLECVNRFELEAAISWQDAREAYHEVRLFALGRWDGRVHSLG